MAIAATGLSACDNRRPQPLTIDNALTADEIAAGILTPEVMWKMSRAGSSSLSPDGRTLLYAQTDYNMAENRGVTTIWVEDLATKAVTRLTDTASNNADPKWSADGEKIYFLSDRSGSMQVWEMTPAGGNARQLSAFDKDVEGFGISPRGDKAWYVQRVEVCDRKSSDVYKDMDKSKARIYDDLMARHWNYWDEGSYLHIFVGDFGAEGLKPGVDIIGKDAAWDAPLAPYFDMAEIAWNNAGTMLAYTCKPLTGTEYAVSTDSDIFVYVLENGVTQNICKPVNVNTGEPIADMATMAGYDKYPVWSPDDRQIAFLSQRRAGNESDKARLFLYDCQTAQMQDLTEDFDYNAMNVVWSGSDMLYFIAPIEATHQICRIAPSVGEVEVVTRGDHDINAFSMAGDRIAAEMCTISMATEFFDVNPADGTLTQISAINKPVYDNIRMGEVQKRWVRSGSTRFRATIRARTSATTSRPSTTWRRSLGPTKTAWDASAHRTADIRSISSPDATRNGSKPSSRTAASSTSSRCTAKPRSCSSSTTITEVPTGIGRTKSHSAPTPIRRTNSSENGTRRC